MLFRSADHRGALAGRAAAQLVERGARILRLAVAERDGVASALAVSLKIEQQHTEACGVQQLVASAIEPLR